MTIKRIFKLFPSCRLVKGVKYSILCDLQRGEYIRFSSKFSEYLNQIGSQYDSKSAKDFYNKLVEMEFGEYVDETEDLRFSELFMKYYSPGFITNSIIDIRVLNLGRFRQSIHQISAIGCRNLYLRIFEEISCDEISELMLIIKDTRIKSVDILIQMATWVSTETLTLLVHRFPNIRTIIISNARINKIIKAKGMDMGNVVFTTQIINSVQNCGYVSENYFNVNIELFTEALSHNTCLNKKLSIDEEGNIKNCPSMK